jgi:hypothetical protein
LRLVLIGVLLASALSVAPALAHDGDGDHSGPGSTGPDQHSQNVKLLSNVPRSNTATQSDLAFFGKYAVAGNYAGFRILDVSDPEAPQVVTDFACNGPQSDVSVMGHLLRLRLQRSAERRLGDGSPPVPVGRLAAEQRRL